MMYNQRLMHTIVLLPFLLLTACAGLSGSRDSHFTCPYDTVWDAALDTLKGHSIVSYDKANGTIETAWIEMEGEKRPYGIFNREGFGNRERARMNASVKNNGHVSSVSVLETRQRWHARGGASPQAAKWWPVEPSQEAMTDVTEKLKLRLKEAGCEIPS